MLSRESWANKLACSKGAAASEPQNPMKGGQNQLHNLYMHSLVYGPQHHIHTHSMHSYTIRENSPTVDSSKNIPF